MLFFKSLSTPVKNSRGLTLVEILIVLAIIGALGAILMPRFQGQLEKANIRQTRIVMGQLLQKIAEYQLECGKAPAALENLVGGGDDCSNWIPDPQFKKVPTDAWKNEFGYEVDGNTFVIISYGSDRREGGSAYAADIRSDELDK